MKSLLQRMPALAAAWIVAGVPFLRGADANPQDLVRFRVAVSTSTVEGVNANDARAAIKIWADLFMQHLGLDAVGERAILMTPDQLVHAVRSDKVDAFSVTTPEYSQISSYVDRALIIGDETEVKAGNQYLLLVNAQSGFSKLPDLRGRNLIIHKGVRTCLAGMWLDTLLSEAGLGSTDQFFGQVTAEGKPAMAVLPVFFRRADAALVTQREFEGMCEMNPQLGKSLRVLATSPKMIHSFLLFHKDCPPQVKARLKDAMLGFHESTAGKQILTLWQSRRLVATDASVLRDALDMIASYERIKSRKGTRQ